MMVTLPLCFRYCKPYRILFVMIVMVSIKACNPLPDKQFRCPSIPSVNQVLKLTIYGATPCHHQHSFVGELMPELAVSAFTTHEGLIEIHHRTACIVVMFFPLSVFRWLLPTFSKVSEWHPRLSSCPFTPIAFPVTLHHYFTHVLGV